MNAPVRTALAVAVALVLAVGVGWSIMPRLEDAPAVSQAPPAMEATEGDTDLPAAPAEATASAGPAATREVRPRDLGQLSRLDRFSAVAPLDQVEPTRPTGPGAAARKVVQDARVMLAVGVHQLSTDLHLDGDEAAEVTRLRTQAEAELDAVATRIRTDGLGADPVAYEVRGIQGRLVDAVSSLLGPARADAVKTRLGPPSGR